MTLSWYPVAWEQYIQWQTADKNIVKRINELVKECMRTPFEGKGKPEMLRANLAGCWSRRITDEHRLVYRVEGDMLFIMRCKNHYEK
ncbi:Txe/YoeB family addiction module toxin [Dyadobacter sp. LJ53]|uniref:Txe/YoeB family addiction module toxin n=1 Tax=Dyadobacter chenwenxiniae TaxID=2906456 RepID=UPI001F304430|nr:Txe/YoeB family addiction module toxin [Dyadobacter chenwenxiniae]MCF0052214.1 Txe/YoeB family addiction module toxin [Dyadobacter chenwenxiniae]